MKKTFIIIGIFTLFGVLLFANYQTIFKAILPPNPRIINSYADGSSSTLFDYSMKVTGEVTNEGGDGYVVVKAFVFQDGKTFNKTKQIYLLSYDTKKFEIVFDEVKLFKKDPTFEVEVFALGEIY